MIQAFVISGSMHTCGDCGCLSPFLARFCTPTHSAFLPIPLLLAPTPPPPPHHPLPLPSPLSLSPSLLHHPTPSPPLPPSPPHPLLPPPSLPPFSSIPPQHYGRGYGYTQYSRGIRIFQVQKWNFEHEVGRYWNRGLRSYLRNETNYFAIEGRVWGTSVKWRPYPRDQVDCRHRLDRRR